MSSEDSHLQSAPPPKQTSQVTTNNQNTVYLHMALSDADCFLHDNRIYAFAPGARDAVQETLLGLLTTTKYRAMQAMYLLFRILDNGTFLAIIVLTVLEGHLALPTSRDIALLSAFAVEFFYDLMLFLNKYWILQRLSFYVGLIMYLIYGVVLSYKNSNGDYSEADLNLLIGVLSLRFTAFILEETADVAIDCSIHNDLLKLTPSNNRQAQPSQTIERSRIDDDE